MHNQNETPAGSAVVGRIQLETLYKHYVIVSLEVQ